MLTSTPQTKAPGTAPPPPPGAVICQNCGGHEWSSGWGVVTWIGVVLLFPIGLLFLLAARTHTCQTCGYTYTGRPCPPQVQRKAGPVTMAITVLLLLGAVALVVALLARAATM